MHKCNVNVRYGKNVLFSPKLIIKNIKLTAIYKEIIK